MPRNFQILSPLDFLALRLQQQGTQHRPSLCSGARPKGSHLIRGHRPKVGRGWYLNKSRGMRKKAEAAATDAPSSEQPTTSRSSQAWAMLIKRECGGQMQVVAFIEPPQPDVIEAILKHCGWWQSRSARAPPEVNELVLELDAAFADSSLESVDQADPSQELTYVDFDTFPANF
jgi:hypothetical protein